VTMSHEGYVKRLPVGTYCSRGAAAGGSRGAIRAKAILVEHLFVANTHDNLLFFTNQAAFTRGGCMSAEMSRTSRAGGGDLIEFHRGKRSPMCWPSRIFPRASSSFYSDQERHREETPLESYANIRFPAASSPSALKKATY